MWGRHFSLFPLAFLRFDPPRSGFLLLLQQL
jgi:hypothetical protein